MEPVYTMPIPAVNAEISSRLGWPEIQYPLEMSTDMHGAMWLFDQVVRFLRQTYTDRTFLASVTYDSSWVVVIEEIGEGYHDVMSQRAASVYMVSDALRMVALDALRSVQQPE